VEIIRINYTEDSPKRQKKKLRTHINGKFNDTGSADENA
jgi:hypothetical protein